MSNNYRDISNNLSIDLQIPFTGTMNEQGRTMTTRHQLAQNPILNPQLALETQKIRDRRHPTALICTIDLEESTTWKKAISVPHWYKAMEEEILALHSNKTWSLVPRPARANVIGSNWIFKTKLKNDGTLD